MIKLAKIISTTPGIRYHIEHGLALHENIYRYSSKEFVNLFFEARLLYNAGKIDLIEADIDLITTTDIGEYGVYEGKQIPLDLPMATEAKYQGKDVDLNKPKRGGAVVKNSTFTYEILKLRILKKFLLVQKTVGVI